MDLLEAMRCAPTSRWFTAQDVPPQAIRRSLDAARFAPSGGNRQGWRVIVVREPEIRRALAELYLPAWRSYIEASGADQLLQRPGDFAPSAVRMARGGHAYAENLAAVPVHIVVAVRLQDLAVTDARLERQSIVGGASIYPFVQNLLLALRGEGLGAAMTTLLVAQEERIKQLLEIPDGIALAAHIGVGVRSDPWPARLSRRSVEEFAFGERWGRPLPAPGDLAACRRGSGPSRGDAAVPAARPAPRG